jgi:hypothetical protein
MSPITPLIMRYLLLGCILCMLALAIAYLSQRKLIWWAYFAYGLLALFPILGPLLVISMQPGQRRVV